MRASNKASHTIVTSRLRIPPFESPLDSDLHFEVRHPGFRQSGENATRTAAYIW